ncbi:MAG: dihydroorotate dehydrogenase (quinone), partial [Mesorhizobium sp.]
DLVQLYTGMIYAGPALPGRILAGMARFADMQRLKSLRELRDSSLDQWSSKPL